jgi:hypothetical protein
MALKNKWLKAEANKLGQGQKSRQGQSGRGHFRRLVDQTSTCNPGAPGSSNIRKETREKQDSKATREERKQRQAEPSAKRTRQRLSNTWKNVSTRQSRR